MGLAYLVLGLMAALGAPLQAATGTLMPSPYQTVFDTNGNPVNNAKICTYLAGTTTLTTTWSEVTLTTPNANPIRADAAGRFVVYLSPGASYKFVYQDATGTAGTCDGAAIKTVDNVSAVPGSSANLDITGTAGEALTAGQAVYLSDGSGGKTAGLWYKSDSANTYSSTLPEVGIVPASIASGLPGSVRLAGSVTGLSSLIVGGSYYVGTAGAITSTAPTNSRFIGVADTTTSLVLTPNPTSPAVPIANNIVQGRLTLTTAVPVTTADVTAATTLYFSPYGGNLIALYNGTTAWSLVAFTEISIAVPATTSQMYDVFVYSNAGVATLELLAWTNDTTRATALVLQNGVLSKTGALTRRYVGSFRTTTVSGQTEDSVAKRYLWNYYNRVPRILRVVDTADTWNYNTNTYRQANANVANQLDAVIGVAEVPIHAQVLVAAICNTAGSATIKVGIGEDSTTTVVAGTINPVSLGDSTSTAQMTLVAVLDKYPAIGRHTYVWLEAANCTVSATWYGDNAGVNQSGIFGWVDG